MPIIPRRGAKCETSHQMHQPSSSPRYDEPMFWQFAFFLHSSLVRMGCVRRNRPVDHHTVGTSELIRIRLSASVKTQRSGLGGMSFAVLSTVRPLIQLGYDELLVVALKDGSLLEKSTLPRRLRHEIRRSVEDEAQLSPRVISHGDIAPRLHRGSAELSASGRPYTEIETPFQKPYSASRSSHTNVRWRH